MVVGKEAVLCLLNTVSDVSHLCLQVSCFYMHMLLRKVTRELHNMLCQVQADAGAKAKEGIFALLWNRGSEHFQVLLGLVHSCHSASLQLCRLGWHAQAKAYSSAASMYGAALIYSATDMDKAQTARQLSLCHLGMSNHSKCVITAWPC